MIYKIFTVVFLIAEIIITYSIIINLIKLDKKILELNAVISVELPSIKDVACLIRKISEQSIEFSSYLVESINTQRDKILINQLNKLLIAMLFMKINSKFIRQIRHSSIVRHIRSGLSLLQLVV